MGARKGVVPKGNTSLGQLNPAFVSKTIPFCLVFTVAGWVWGRGLGEVGGERVCVWGCHSAGSGLAIRIQTLAAF